MTADDAVDGSIRDIRHAATAESIQQLPRITTSLTLRALDSSFLNAISSRHQPITIGTLGTPVFVTRLLSRRPLGVLGSTAPGRLGAAVRLLHHVQGTTDATELPVETVGESLPEYTVPVRSLLSNQPDGSPAPLAADFARQRPEPETAEPVDGATETPTATVGTTIPDAPREHLSPPDTDPAPADGGSPTDEPQPDDRQPSVQSDPAPVDHRQQPPESSQPAANGGPRQSTATQPAGNAPPVPPSVSVTQAATVDSAQRQPFKNNSPRSGPTALPSLTHIAAARPSQRTPISSQPTAAATAITSRPTAAAQPATRRNTDHSAPTAAPQPRRIGETGARLSYLATASPPPSSIPAHPQQSPQPAADQPTRRGGTSGESTTTAVSEQPFGDGAPASPVARSGASGASTRLSDRPDQSTEPLGSAAFPTDHSEQPPAATRGQSARRHDVDPHVNPPDEDAAPVPSVADATAASETTATHDSLAVRDHSTEPRPRASPVFAANRIHAHAVDRSSVWDREQPTATRSRSQPRVPDATGSSAPPAVNRSPVGPSSATGQASTPDTYRAAPDSSAATPTAATPEPRSPTAPAEQTTANTEAATDRHLPAPQQLLQQPRPPQPPQQPRLPQLPQQPRPPQLPQPPRPAPLALLPTVQSTLAAAGTERTIGDRQHATTPFQLIGTETVAPGRTPVSASTPLARSTPESPRAATASQTVVREAEPLSEPPRTARHERTASQSDTAAPTAPQSPSSAAHGPSTAPEGYVHRSSPSGGLTAGEQTVEPQAAPAQVAAPQPVSPDRSTRSPIETVRSMADGLQSAGATPSLVVPTRSTAATATLPVAPSVSAATATNPPATVDRQSAPEAALDQPPVTPTGQPPTPTDRPEAPTGDQSTSTGDQSTSTGDQSTSTDPPARQPTGSTVHTDSPIHRPAGRSTPVGSPGVGNRPTAADSQSTPAAVGEPVPQSGGARPATGPGVASPLRPSHVPPATLVGVTAPQSPSVGRLSTRAMSALPAVPDREQSVGIGRARQADATATTASPPGVDIAAVSLEDVGESIRADPSQGPGQPRPLDRRHRPRPAGPVDSPAATPEQTPAQSAPSPDPASAIPRRSTSGSTTARATTAQPTARPTAGSRLGSLGTVARQPPLGSYRPAPRDRESSDTAVDTPTSQPAGDSAGQQASSAEPFAVAESTVSEPTADPLSDVPSLVHQQSLAAGDSDTDDPLAGGGDGPSIAQLAGAFTTSESAAVDTSQVAARPQDRAGTEPSGLRWRPASEQSLTHPRSRYAPQEPAAQSQDELEHPRASRRSQSNNDPQGSDTDTPQSPFSSPPGLGQPQSTPRQSTEVQRQRSTTDPSSLADTLQSGARTDELVGQLYREMERKRRIERKRRGL